MTANNPASPTPCGTIILSNSIGRALRKQPASINASGVVDCCGEFRAGDLVNITFRGADGGQFAIATAVAAIDATTLRAARSGLASVADALVVERHDLKLLWR